jgi:hypothetical protein
MSTQLSILGRAAWAPGLSGDGDWDEWARGRRAIESAESSPDLAFLPALFKRRLGQLDRMALFAGHEALGGRKPVRTVLATRRGEIGQQYRISSSLAESGEISPAAFSLSVFNAPVSLLSMAEGNTGSTSAVHAGENSFSAGLACSAGMLAVDEAPVLLIAADELLPEAYAEIEGGRGESYALALLLAPSREGSESISIDAASSGEEPKEPEALAFLRWLIAGKGELRLGGEWPLRLRRAGNAAERA